MASERISTNIYALVLFTLVILVFWYLFSAQQDDLEMTVTGKATSVTVQDQITAFLRSPHPSAGTIAGALVRKAIGVEFETDVIVKEFLEKLETPKNNIASGWNLAVLLGDKEQYTLKVLDISVGYETARYSYSFGVGEEQAATLVFSLIECPNMECFE